METNKFYILTEEELERFDHMITALAQAYWALVTHRPIELPKIDPNKTPSSQEENFYQLHLGLNDHLDTTFKF